MDAQTLADELSRFGLSRRQSEAYIFLLTKGPKTASQIARNMDRNRSDTYRVLNELLELGLVEKQLSTDRKTLFTPTPPKEAISRILADKKKEVDELSQRAEETADQLDAVRWRPRESTEEPEFLRIAFRIVGETGVPNAIERMLRSAKQEIDITISNRNLSLWSVQGMDDVLRDAAERGVRTRIITKIERENSGEVEQLCAFCQIRHVENTLYNTCIADDEVITGAPTGNTVERGRYDAYLATSEQGLVETLKTFFERTWETSTDAQEKLQALKQETNRQK